jgi:uncharacterized protein (DUF1697 family)
VQYAAFLRAINVGRANRIRMEELRALCAGLGFEDVRTHVQTGNLVFESSVGSESVAATLEAALAAHGLKNANAMVRTRQELAAVVAACPFDDYPRGEYRCYVTFFRDTIGGGELHKLEGVVGVLEREVLTAIPSDAPPGQDINGTLGRRIKIPSTTRYWNVARDVLDLMPPP